MKKTLLLSTCLLAGVMTAMAQQTLYVIDNATVEHFDGSQLKGKTIRDYKITTKGSGRNAITVHAITTAPSAFSLSLPHLDSLKLPDFNAFGQFTADTVLLGHGVSVISKLPKKMVYVIDGKRFDDPAAFQSLSSGDIASITVLKEGSPEQLKYGENTSVIMITTKKEKDALTEFFKTLPGAKVEADGTITVNGEPIKRVTINGRAYSVESGSVTVSGRP
jgi:hypothetical protein